MSKASSKYFRLVPLQDVLSFVEWDIHWNNLFVVSGVIVRQQEKGVHIRGFLSAQLICLSLPGIEFRFRRIGTVMPPLAPYWPRHLPYPLFRCGMSLTFPFVAFVMVPMCFTPLGCMDGSTKTSTYCFEQSSLNSPCLYTAGPWDSHPEGCVGKIIDKSLDKQRPFIAVHF